VLGLAAARIDVQRPLGSLGFDSLMTLELHNRLESSLGVLLSATVAWNHPTISALAEHLARAMDLALGAPAPAPPTSDAPSSAAVAPARVVAVNALSDDEVAVVLAEKLGHIEERSS
jgi:acyl carrier protein